MAEPSKDRDKAVDEAWAWACSNSPNDDVALRLLWQRAQEAEREENCKAVCRYCAEDFAGCEMVPVKLPDLGWVHRAKGEPENVLMCAAGHIRNRRTG